MKDSKQNNSRDLALGTISILRTLVELDQAGVTNLSLDDAVAAQRGRGDGDQVADAIETIRNRPQSTS